MIITLRAVCKIRKNSLNQWSKVVVEKQLLPWDVKNFSSSYRTGCELSVFTTAHPFSIYWVTLNQSMPSHRISLRSILICLDSTPESCKWSLSLRVSYQNSLCIKIRRPPNNSCRLQATRLPFELVCPTARDMTNATFAGTSSQLDPSHFAAHKEDVLVHHLPTSN
jgi:hypothetical protein